MKFIYKGIGLISILFIVASCSFSKKHGIAQFILTSPLYGLNLQE